MSCLFRFKQYKNLLNETDSGQLFSFNDKYIYAKCVSVYDGDTMTIKFFYRGELLKYKIRLMGLDTPELKSRNLEEKELSGKIKKYVSEMILNKIIKIKCYDFDKYGRILGDIYMKTDKGDICLNQYLIDNKFALGYKGDTKQEFVRENYNWNVEMIPLKTLNYSLWNYLKN